MAGSPAVILSSLRNPVPTPVISRPDSCSWLIRSKESFSRPAIGKKSLVMRWSAIPNTTCSAWSTSSCGSPSRS